jgi:phosphoglycerate dehydrogenase-like enzyme
MTLALYFKPSYERLKERIQAAAPSLQVALYDENGKCWLNDREVSIAELQPEYFWIHSELFVSPQLKTYFQLMLASPSIKWLHTINTGLDQLPYLPLVERGVTVTNNHAQAIAISEFIFGQVLAHYQDVYDYRAKQQAKVWKHRGFREIQGSHWLIVGFGEIGQGVAQRAKAFGATVTAVRRHQDTAGLADAVIPQARLAEVLPSADVVVIACAANDETRGMVNAQFLQAMKDKSVLVNVARGDLVVERDLRVALDTGKPDFAVLDVFNQEPPPLDSWVWAHPRVSLTPHTSNAGSGMRARSEANFLDNLARISSGRPLNNLVKRQHIV